MSIYEEITHKILDLFKGGTVPWRRPWHLRSKLGPRAMPQNAVSRRHYRGINIPLLWIAQHTNGYETPLWGTKKCWASVCGEPYRFQEPTSVYLFRKIPGKEGKKDAFFLASFPVYNLAQIYGAHRFKGQVLNPLSNAADIDYAPAEKLIAGTKARIIHRGEKAFYKVDTDTIHLPTKGLFQTQRGYYTTKMHEMIHWTGHEKRLKRKFALTKNSPEYAFEELVAELGTCFACSRIGIPESMEEMPNHVNYMATWFQILQKDEKAMFKASSLASKASDYLWKINKD